MDDSFKTDAHGPVISVFKEHVICWVVLLILNIPGFLIDISTIYHTEHRFAEGDFAQLNYNFTAFELFLVLWGTLLLAKKSRSIHMLPIIGAVAVKDIVLFLLQKDNVISYNSYEMYLCVLIGIACKDIICKETKDSIQYINYFLDLLIVFNLVWQIILVASGKIAIGDRVNAINMGYGSVGYLCAMHILYILLVREIRRKEIIIIVLGLLSILLSGSRYSLLITLLGALIFSGYIFRNLSKTVRRWIIAILLLLVFSLSFLLLQPSMISENQILNRALNLFEGGNIIENISNDESFLGRVLSIQIGWDLIRKNPLGISNSFIDIQGKTIEEGFFAFPHSNLMTYYLLWGAVLIICLGWMVRTCIIASRQGEKGIKYFMILFMVSNIVYGGVDTAPKVYTYLFLLLSVLSLRLKKQILDEGDEDDFQELILSIQE